MKRNIKKQTGSAMIEFVLVFPALFMIFSGIIDFSCMLYDKTLVADAARQGARYGTLYLSPGYPSTSQVVTYTTNYCKGKFITFSSTTTNPTATATQSGTTTGSTLTVTVSYVYTDLIMHYYIGGNAQHTLTSTTVMVYE